MSACASQMLFQSVCGLVFHIEKLSSGVALWKTFHEQVREADCGGEPDLLAATSLTIEFAVRLKCWRLCVRRPVPDKGTNTKAAWRRWRIDPGGNAFLEVRRGIGQGLQSDGECK